MHIAESALRDQERAMDPQMTLRVYVELWGNLDPLKEQPVHSTAKPTLQLPIQCFFFFNDL